MDVTSVNSIATIDKPIKPVEIKTPAEKILNPSINTKDSLNVSATSQKECPVPNISVLKLSGDKVAKNTAVSVLTGSFIGVSAGLVTAAPFALAGASVSKVLPAALVGAGISIVAFVGLGIKDSIKDVKEAKAEVKRIQDSSIEQCKSK